MFGLLRRSLPILVLLPTLALAQQAAAPAAPAAPQPYADLNRKFQQFEWARQDLTTAIEKELREKDQALEALRQQVEALRKQLEAKQEPPPAPPPAAK
jgi:Skp family chaperone for outer membrane proteins